MYIVRLYQILTNINMKNFLGLRETKDCGTELYTQKALKKDEILFHIDGPITDKPSTYTIPVDHGKYIDPTSEGMYLNHSCEPTCGVKDNEYIVALDDLPIDAPITIDYAMIVHHYSSKLLKQVTTCLCGKPSCRGEYGSYVTLPENLKKKYQGYVSEYLLRDTRNE